MSETPSTDHLLPTVYNPFRVGLLIRVPKGSTYAPMDWLSHMEGMTENEMEVEVTGVGKSDMPFKDIPDPHCISFIDEKEDERSLLVSLALVNANGNLFSPYRSGRRIATLRKQQ